jgi:hypothetical protein
MNDAKYIRMDVHQATILAAVRDSSGNLVLEATLETKTETILEFVHGLRGSLRTKRCLRTLWNYRGFFPIISVCSDWVSLLIIVAKRT